MDGDRDRPTGPEADGRGSETGSGSVARIAVADDALRSAARRLRRRGRSTSRSLRAYGGALLQDGVVVVAWAAVTTLVATRAHASSSLAFEVVLYGGIVGYALWRPPLRE